MVAVTANLVFHRPCFPAIGPIVRSVCRLCPNIVTMNALRRAAAAHLRHRSWLILMALALCGCDTRPNEAALQKLQRNRTAWGSHDIADYELVFHRSCFCDPALLEPVRPVVRNRRTVQLTRISDGLSVPVDSTFYMNVDQLFAWLKDYLQDSRARVGRLEYDSQYSFPTHVHVYRLGWVDTDQNIDLSGFTIPWRNLGDRQYR